MPDIKAEGWTALFNGSDITGWIQRNGTATYRVEEGVIIGKTAEGSPNSFLCTEKDYGDFELTFEVKVDQGLNSGVQIRSLSKSDFKDGRVHGPQVEIENAPGESGYIYSEGTGRDWITTEQPIKGRLQERSVEPLRRPSRRQPNPRPGSTAARSLISTTPNQAESASSASKSTASTKRPAPTKSRWKDIRIREM